MTNKSPIFPFQQPQHFSDYGFDPQIDYFQVLEEARKHKQRETASSFRLSSSSSIIDNLHFKLQKPISKDNDSSKKIKKNRQRWWKNAFHFFKRKRTNKCDNIVYSSGTSVRAFSGPVYFTDSSKSESSGPYHHHHHRSSRPSSGPLTGGEFDISIPYISLTQLNMDHPHHKMSASPMPIYLVT